jgi:3',5'-cyclic AMP phosphodiesterase CpdA
VSGIFGLLRSISVSGRTEAVAAQCRIYLILAVEYGSLTLSEFVVADCIPATFLVLSDIHFGEFAYVPELACANAAHKRTVQKSVPLVDSLIAAVRQCSPQPNAILAPGDLTSIAAPCEFDGCVKIVQAIAEKLEIKKENVFFTFGNHDTNWRIADLAKASKKFAADEDYTSVAGLIGGMYAHNSGPVEAGPVVGSGVFIRDGFVLFVLNSGHSCTSDQRYPHGHLGKEQLGWIQTALSRHIALAKWNVMMVHHHPFNYPFPTPVEDISSIQEGAELVEFAGDAGIDVICHGHRHHPKIFTEHKNSWRHPITFVCAGSVAVNEHHRMRGEIPNLFHILHLQNRLKDGAAFGHVITHRYKMADGWLHVSNDAKYTPLDPVQRFGVMSNDTEFEDIIRNTVTQALAGDGEVWSLPRFEDLHLILQCTGMRKLNDAFRRDAKSRGMKFLGDYPNEVYIKK